MKYFYIFLVVALFPILAFSETIFFKDGTTINPNVYWQENNDTIGYFVKGKSKYIKMELIDWEKTKERHPLTKSDENRSKNSIINQLYLDENSIIEDMNLYLKSLGIINKYGTPVTLPVTNNDQWVAYFPKGDFTIIADKITNKIISVIDGRGLQ